MDKLQIYLAGKMSGLTFNEMNEWRKDIKSIIEKYASYVGVDVNVINPVDYFNFEEKRYKSELEVMKFDLNKVKNSDIIVVNMKGLNTSIGTCIELYEAYKRDIPVLAFGSEEEYNELHPWIQCFITRHDDSYNNTAFYISEFYMM